MPVRPGIFTRLDFDDYLSFSWLYWRYDQHGYVYNRYKISGKTKERRLHRLIVNAQPGEIVDHKDHDKLNNRRSNLRIVTAPGNSINRTAAGASGFTGVYYIDNIWRVHLQMGGQTIVLGQYHSIEDAIRCRTAAETAIIEGLAELGELSQPVITATALLLHRMEIMRRRYRVPASDRQEMDSVSKYKLTGNSKWLC